MLMACLVCFGGNAHTHRPNTNRKMGPPARRMSQLIHFATRWAATVYAHKHFYKQKISNWSTLMICRNENGDDDDDERNPEMPLTHPNKQTQLVGWIFGAIG